MGIFQKLIDRFRHVLDLSPHTQSIPGYPTQNLVAPVQNTPAPYYIFYDDETANSRSQRICQIGYVVTDIHGNILAPTTCQLIQPECAFDQRCINVHGITEEQVAGMPTLAQYCQSSQFLWLLRNCVFVAHNAKSADLSHLKKSLSVYNIEIPTIRFVDTKAMAKGLGFQKQDLATLCQFYQIPLPAHHNAGHDAMACYQLFGAMLRAGASVEPQLWNPTMNKKQSTQNTKKKATNTKGTKKTYYDNKMRRAQEQNTVYGSSKPIPEVLSEFDSARLLVHASQLKALADYNIVVSGFAPNLSLEQITQQVQALGGTIKTGMSKKVNLLVIGASAGPAKIKYAMENKVMVISAVEFERALAQMQIQEFISRQF